MPKIFPGDLVKKTILTLISILALSSTLVFAETDTDPAEELQAARCESEEALELMGEGGTCRLLVAENHVKSKKGYCVGQSLLDYTCEINFESKDNGDATVKLKCGISFLDGTFKGKLTGVSIVGLITTA